jgi:hypothetical protein
MQLNHRTQDQSSCKVWCFNTLICATRYTIKQVRKCLQPYNFAACALLLSVYSQFVNIVNKTYSHIHYKFQHNFPHLTQHIICHLYVSGTDLHLIMLNLYSGDGLCLCEIETKVKETVTTIKCQLLLQSQTVHHTEHSLP